jgi:quercetin dioxygenase-like cupin family protein
MSNINGLAFYHLIRWSLVFFSPTDPTLSHERRKMPIISGSNDPASMHTRGGISVEHQRQITPLLQTALTATAGKQIVVLLAEVPPDDTGVGHYHPGDEVIYVLEGSVTFTVDGQPDITLHAGETCHLPAKQVHFGKTGSTGLKFLSIHVEEIGTVQRTLAAEAMDKSGSCVPR